VQGYEKNGNQGNGGMGVWRYGIMEYWSIGVLEYWSIGVLECL